jgi:hypothetical protein
MDEQMDHEVDDEALAGQRGGPAPMVLGEAAEAEQASTSGEKTERSSTSPEPEPAEASAPDDTADRDSVGEPIKTTGSHPAEQQAVVRRLPPIASQSRGRRRIGCWSIAILLLVCLLALASFGGVSAYLQYSHVRSEAADAVLHLKRVQALLAPVMAHPSIPDTATLRAVEAQLTTAERDLALTRHDLGDGVFSLAARAPAARGTIDPITTLLNAADEACLAGLDLVRAAGILVPVLRGGFVGAGASSASGSVSGAPPAQAPTLTAAMLQQLTTDFEDAVSRVNTAIAAMRHADLSALPPNLVTSRQLAELRGLIAQWPRIEPQVAVMGAWLHVAPSLLGVDRPEQFLVELMDRGEMRSTGGYIGNVGVMTIQAGKILPFSLDDVYSFDRPYLQKAGWPDPPPAYPWWPFPGFALRDSNLSPDFPTTAQMGIHLMAAEGGLHVQGVVALNAVAIERVLAIVGPVTVPEYHQTVTAQNLEALIRSYTENPIARFSSFHERFTTLLGRAFQSKVHDLPASQLVAIAQALLTSMRTKDIQVYLSDKAAEALLSRQGLDASLAHGPGDGLTIVDSNLTVNKANIFTMVTYADAVTLDTSGTATHRLTITYRFDSSTNPSLREYLYGSNFYLTYLRVYASPDARLVSVDGFNRGEEEINASDEPGRQMWGGLVWVWDGIPYSLHFVWSVPHSATWDTTGHWRYTLDIQHQAGSNQQLNLTIVAPGARNSAVTYRGALDQDQNYSVAYDSGLSQSRTVRSRWAGAQ